MLLQLLDVLRRTVLAQVIGRGAQHVVEVAELARDQTGIFQFTHADRAVKALFVQVEVIVAHGQFEPDVRDRKSVVSGKSVSVRVDLGGRRIIKKKKKKTK